jgi:hypothetical protein
MGSCAVTKTLTGTIAAIVEYRIEHYLPGAPIRPGEERDVVYRQVGDDWTLVLRRIPPAEGQGISELYESDVMRDHNPVDVFVEPAVGSSYGDSIDVVAGTGRVTLHRQLDRGFAVVASAGGLTTYIPVPAGGYEATSLHYVPTLGGWKVEGLFHLTSSQAEALATHAFVDPAATQVSPALSTAPSSTTTTSTPGKATSTTSLKVPRSSGSTSTSSSLAPTSSSSAPTSG